MTEKQMIDASTKLKMTLNKHAVIIFVGVLAVLGIAALL